MTDSPSPSIYRAVVVCNGDAPSPELLRREAGAADLVVCADGGMAHCERAGVRVDAVAGDMDSLVSAAPGTEVVNAGSHESQECSDSEKAVRLAVDRARLAGAARAIEVTLLGATGSRPDHGLANLLLCAAYANEARVRLLHDDWLAEVVVGARDLDLPVGRTVSLLPLGPEATLRTSGLVWEIAGSLPWGTRGLSNRVAGTPVSIEVTAGAVAVLVLEDRVLTHGEV